MTTTLNFCGYRINLVMRHRFEKNLDLLDKMRWKEYKIGLWFKTYLALSTKTKKISEGVTSRGYMLGLHLLICKCWIDICHKPLTFKID